MKSRRAFWLAGVSISVVALAWVGFQQASLRALDEPGRAETYFATKAKRILVRREARGIRRLESHDRAQSGMIGEMQFRARCASCHGLDGRTPSDIGVAMYPRASDLGSPEVQTWSDAELFWIIQNGIRLTGMPGFGKSLADQDIWPLVDYIRSLRSANAGEARDLLPTVPASREQAERRRLPK
jgi:mono/diheme cytochrome c family protein